MTDLENMSPEEREIEQKMVKVISQMPANVQNRFKVLHMLSDERSKINDEFEKEVKALEAKFMERKKPLLQKRNDIVLGKITDFAEYVPKYEQTQKANEEIVVGVVKSDKDKAEDEEEAKSHVPTDVTHLKGVAGIPDFWATAIKNNQMMMQTIREKDAETLQYITNVEASETQEPRTVTIKIYYKENEYFTNPHLELMVRFKDD
jgi:nucleosome assembly protein 1-like 1